MHEWRDKKKTGREEMIKIVKNKLEELNYNKEGRKRPEKMMKQGE